MTKRFFTYPRISSRSPLYRSDRPIEVAADPNQVNMGVVVEQEHTDSDETAYIITLDHLAEIPDYYTLLLKMERNAR